MAQNNKIPFPLKIKQEIKDIKQEQTTQNTDITKNKQDIADLDTNKASKSELQEATIALQAELKATRKDLECGTLEGQDTGESLYLQDSSDARFREFGIGGNSEQEKREGYNLIEQKVTSMTGANSEISFDEEGFMTASNSSDKTSYINITADSSRITTGKSYTLKTEFKGEGSAVFLMNSASDYSKNTTASGSLTNTATTSYMNVLIALQSNTTTKVRFTLAEGTDNKEYEQYGAMPSLEFPSEVEAVGQDVNIFDKDNVNVIENAFINSETMSIATVAGRRCFYLPCKSNQEYSVLRKKVGQAFALGTTAGLPQAGSTIVDINVKNDEFETIKTSSNANYLVVYYKKKAAEEVDEDILNNIKIVKGTEINGYSPYNCGSANVTICNKNVLPIQLEETQTANGITVINNKGRLTINGTSTAGFQFDIAKNFYLPKNNSIFNPNEISGTVTNTEEGVFPTYSMRNADNVQLITGMANRVGKNIPKTISASLLGNIMKFCTLWIPKNTVFNNFVIEPQIEAGNTATDYIAHEEQTLTMPIQSEILEGDYLDLDSEEEVHTWGKVELKGTENIALNNNNNKSIFYFDIPGQKASKELLKSNTYTYSTVSWQLIKDKQITNEDGNIAIFIREDEVKNIIDFKTKLQELYNAGTPVTIYYKLETPIKLPFTASQKAVAKQIREKLHSYKGGTHVYSVDEISPIFNAKYTKDLNAVINNLSQQAIEGGN